MLTETTTAPAVAAENSEANTMYLLAEYLGCSCKKDYDFAVKSLRNSFINSAFDENAIPGKKTLDVAEFLNDLLKAGDWYFGEIEAAQNNAALNQALKSLAAEIIDKYGTELVIDLCFYAAAVIAHGAWYMEPDAKQRALQDIVYLRYIANAYTNKPLDN